MSGRRVGWGDSKVGADKPKKSKGKSKSKGKKPEVVDIAIEFGLEDDLFNEFGEPKDEKAKKTKKTKKKTKKKKTKKVTKKAKQGKAEDLDYGIDDAGDGGDVETPPWEEKPGAPELRIDLSSECPVCRSLEDCECEEEDRSFLRRVRFSADVKQVPRCERCQAPLSVLYLVRPGVEPGDTGFRLAHFVAVHGCAICHGTALATTALSTGRLRPQA